MMSNQLFFIFANLRCCLYQSVVVFFVAEGDQEATTGDQEPTTSRARKRVYESTVPDKRLASPKRKPPTCSGCGATGHRNLPSQCPLRKEQPMRSKRKPK